MAVPSDAAADTLCMWIFAALTCINITNKEFMLKYTTFIGALETWVHSIKDGKHVYSINTSNGLSPRTLLLVVKHYVPASCRPHDDPCGWKNNEINQSNPCINVWCLVIVCSLCKEAGAAWNTEF